METDHFLQGKLSADGGAPKKLLAFDGGGIRGALAIEIAAGIENILRTALGKGPGFVLADWFDFIGGTSTGGIIATCLSLGMSAAQVRDFYHREGARLFSKAAFLKRFQYKYDDDNLAGMLREVIGGDDVTLGTDHLKTLLLLMMRNATTDSPWPLSNNPRALYNDRARANCNLDLPLWRLVRASTAAPTYFPPEVIEVGDKRFTFVDGGVTMYNNPAFQMFLMATVDAFRLGWPTGRERLLVVSVGTGAAPDANADLAPGDMNLIYNATRIPSALMYAALNEQDMLCRVFGDCRHGAPLDREQGDLCGAAGSGAVPDKLFTYMRYNAELTRAGLDALGLPDIKPEEVQQMDAVEYLPQLQTVGEAVAREVVAEHFAGFAA